MLNPRSSAWQKDLLLLLHRGTKGVAFSDALDKNKECPTVPEYGMPEYDSKPLGRLHASIPALQSSADVQEVSEGAESGPEAQPVRYVALVITLAWQYCHIGGTMIRN